MDWRLPAKDFPDRKVPASGILQIQHLTNTIAAVFALLLGKWPHPKTIDRGYCPVEDVISTH